MRKIGIYSGTFDPLHAGHVTFAKKALQLCKLDEVVFLPEKKPRGKDHVTNLEARTGAIRTTLADQAMSVFVSDSDQFNVRDTLLEIESNFPNAVFTLLIGSDIALKIGNWPDISELVRRWSFAIGMRDRDNIVDVEHSLEMLEKTTKLNIRYVFIETNQSHVASSQLR